MSGTISANADVRPRVLSGRKRVEQLAAESRAVIEAITADLLKSLNRPPMPTENLLAEAIAATTVRCRRLRENGRCDASERRELAKLLRRFNALPTAAQARETA